MRTEKKIYVKPYTAVLNVQTEGVIAASGVIIDENPYGSGFCENYNFSAPKHNHTQITSQQNCMKMEVGKVYCGYNDLVKSDVHFWALEVDDKDKATKIAYKKCEGC